MHLISGAAQRRKLAVQCRYRSADPYAVELDFGADEGGAVWVLSRELLRLGLRGPAGDGDVHIEPGDGDMVFIALGGRVGIALLNAPADPLARFLAATEDLVPTGRESSHLDWERCITALLAT
ncbi:SsgA family sporulation/cell division regulator [Kitasatospora sp. NPDC057940]|uniref:SsgA family sporulation/cell division regulator n=1 Tax=Kitasatospora sp. NPDC057940 TaxID=3346285 RepID=UPI0036DBECE9